MKILRKIVSLDIGSLGVVTSMNLEVTKDINAKNRIIDHILAQLKELLKGLKAFQTI